MTLAILFSLKTMELLEYGLQCHSGETPLYSVSIASVIVALTLMLGANGPLKSRSKSNRVVIYRLVTITFDVFVVTGNKKLFA